MHDEGKDPLAGVIFLAVFGGALAIGTWIAAINFDPPFRSFSNKGPIDTPHSLALGASFFGTLFVLWLRGWRKALIVRPGCVYGKAQVVLIGAILSSMSLGFTYAAIKGARQFDFDAFYSTGDPDAGYAWREIKGDRRP